MHQVWIALQTTPQHPISNYLYLTTFLRAWSAICTFVFVEPTPPSPTMRPLPGEDAFADNDTTPLASRSQPPQMSYFIADEKTVESSQSPSLTPPVLSKHRDAAKISMHSTYGVESLETTISSLPPSLDSDDHEEELRVRKARQNWKKNMPAPTSRQSDEDFSDSRSPSFKSSGEVSRDVSPSHERRPSQTTLSRPYSPLSLGSPAPPSLLSSQLSRRNSDDGSCMDDLASQAMASSGDEEQEVGLGLMDSGSAPQLVMPSIKMPSRRPFTEKGKSMGRMKVLIAGDSGMLFIPFRVAALLTKHRSGQNLLDQSDCSNLRRYRSCRSHILNSHIGSRGTTEELKDQVQEWVGGYTTNFADHRSVCKYKTLPVMVV